MNYIQHHSPCLSKAEGPGQSTRNQFSAKMLVKGALGVHPCRRLREGEGRAEAKLVLEPQSSPGGPLEHTWPP